MKSRKKRIAVFLVVAFIAQLIYPYGTAAFKDVKAANTNMFYDDKKNILPYYVDLSDENTVVSGESLEVKIKNFFPDMSLLRYYSSIKYTYELKYKDESLKQEQLSDKELPEETWYFDTVGCSFSFMSEDSLRQHCKVENQWIDMSEQVILLPNIDERPSSVDDCEYCVFRIDLYSCQGRVQPTWPLQVESLQLKTIEFIPYENARLGIAPTTPEPTIKPVNDFDIPESPEPIIDGGNQNCAGKDFSIDLSRFQTSFNKPFIWFDLRDDLKGNWYNFEQYSKIKIHCKIETKDDEAYRYYGKEYLCNFILFSAVYSENELNGYSASGERVFCAASSNKKQTEKVFEVDLKPYMLDNDNKKNPVIGLNVQVKSSTSDWPKEIKSITITGIDFIAKKNTVTPTATVTPIIKPTATATPTIKPTTGTTQIKSTNLPINTPVISVPQKITNLKLKAGKKKQIKISWNNQKQADGYEIYRSTKKNKGYQKLADGFKNKCSFTDSKIKYAKNYYYKVRAYCISGKNYQYGVFSDVKKLMLKRKAPAFKLKRKITTDGIHYISIRLKSCSDPYLQMWVRFGKKKYKKIPLSKHKIRKNATLNFKYTPGKGKISFRIRSYRVRNKKREYSKSKTKRI